MATKRAASAQGGAPPAGGGTQPAASKAPPAKKELTQAQIDMKTRMKNVCYWFQTGWNHQCCAGLVANTCTKEHITANTRAEYDMIPIPPEQLKAWKTNSDALKQLGYVPVTPATKASAKGQPKGKGKGGDASKGKGGGKSDTKGAGKDAGKDKKGKGRGKGKKDEKGKGGKVKGAFAGQGVSTHWNGEVEPAVEPLYQDWNNVADEAAAQTHWYCGT